MPELPEVETIKNELISHVIGRRFSSVTICDAKLVRQPSVDDFCRKLVGDRVDALKRRGKYLIFHLSGGNSLIVHLRMSGALLLNPAKTDKHTRIIFGLDDGSCVVISDRRRLGVLWLVDNEESIVGKLGPEPIGHGFNAEVLARRLRGRQAPIKAVLLDQTVVAGIGNMYADEALFAAGIHPLRKASSLAPEEVKALYNAIVSILRSAISSKGASVDTYKRPGGELGTAHFNFCVAHRRGELCLTCGTAIERLAIRNRGSYFCPHCQKLVSQP